ncbi:MAG: SDR family NAD(P)-dependent oxidoreductase [Thermodesulfobacteriota bacterium]
MKLKGKTALITGGGTGIGRATARLFAREGANVVITGRTEKTLNDTSLELGNEGLEISHLAADVSNENDCKKAVDLTISKYCRIDILFNNAGVCYKSSTHETPTSMWDETFDINVKGVFLMSKHALPHMIREGRGSIVNNSSILGLKASPAGFAAYSASKGALNQLTRSMALEYAEKGIRVNAICPGTIYTPMMDVLFEEWGERQIGEKRYISVHPIGRLAQPEEIAHAVLFLCDDNIRFMTGAMLSVDGGMSAK